MAILFNAIASVRMNGETFTKMDALSFLLIITGTSLCMSSSNLDQVDYTKEELFRMLFDERASAYFFTYMLVFMSISYCTLLYVFKMIRKLRSDYQKYQASISSARSETDATSNNASAANNASQIG